MGQLYLAYSECLAAFEESQEVIRGGLINAWAPGHFCRTALALGCVFSTPVAGAVFLPSCPRGNLSVPPQHPCSANSVKYPGFVGYLLFSDFFLSDPLGQGQEEALEVSFPFSMTCELVFFA